MEVNKMMISELKDAMSYEAIARYNLKNVGNPNVKQIPVNVKVYEVSK